MEDEDTSPLLSKEDKKFIQEVTGTLLVCAATFTFVGLLAAVVLVVCLE
jgi:hypothetical protein